jgi:hypothetical protein
MSVDDPTRVKPATLGDWGRALLVALLLGRWKMADDGRR